MKSQPRLINLTFRSLTSLVVLMSWVTGEMARAVPDRWGVKDFTRKLNPRRVPEESFSAAVLNSLLFNPESEEGREGYRVKEKEEGRHIALEAPQTILRPWFQKKLSTSHPLATHHFLTTHHSLLSQPEMTHVISPAVRNRLCNLSHDIVGLRWLESVREPLLRSQVTRFSETLKTMQTVLSDPDSYTHQALFRLVHPAAAFLYEQPGFDPHQSMEEICQTQQIDPRDKRLKDYQGYKQTLRALVGQNVEETPSTDAIQAQSYVREMMVQRDLHHLDDKIGQTYFEAASAFLWTQEDVDRFHPSWRDKASSFLHFNLPDEGRLVRFCCLLGVNPQTTPCLEQAASSLHVGTVANLRTLFDFGADAAREPGVLKKILEDRWTLREHEHAPVLSEALALLVEKAPTQDVPIPQTLALIPLSSRDEILRRPLTHLAGRHMPFGWEMMWHTLFARDPSLPNHTRLQTAEKDYGLPTDLYRRLYPHGVFAPLLAHRLSHLVPGDLR